MGEMAVAVGVLFSLFFLLYQTSLISEMRSVDQVGPVLVPKMIILLAVVLTIFSIYRIIRSQPHIGKINMINKNLLLFLVVMPLIISITEYVGFLLAGVLMFSSVGWILGNRNIIRNLLISVIASSCMLLIFGRMLSVPLPRGVGFLQLLSLWLY